MKDQLNRAHSIYRDNGALELAHAIKKYVEYGSFRDDLLSLLPATEKLLKMRIRAGRYYNPKRFTEADPFKILWIDPDQIVYDISDTDVPPKFGHVYGGTWDQTTSMFSDRPVYQAMYSHFVEDISWEETAYYKRKKSKLEAGRSTRGCTDINDLPMYFNRFDELYKSLQNQGYKSQQTLARKAPAETANQNLDAPTPSLNEIGVCIGRNGSFLRRFRGEHRLAIAKVADVDKVAVQVLARHREWQQLRERILSGDQSSICPSIAGNWDTQSTLHPDLTELS